LQVSAFPRGPKAVLFRLTEFFLDALFVALSGEIEGRTKKNWCTDNVTIWPFPNVVVHGNILFIVLSI